MALMGAFFGYMIGSFLGGPLFGIIFALIGSSIAAGGNRRRFHGGSRQKHSSTWFSAWASPADSRVFMESLFSMLGRLAVADGYVSPREEAEFRSVVVNELRITDPASLASAMNIYHSAASGNTPIDIYARRALSSFLHRRQLLEMMLLIMVRVCAASGNIHPSEDKFLWEVAQIFGYSQGAYQSIKARYGAYSSSGADSSDSGTDSKTNSAFQILGVSQNSSEAEIRKAYRKKVAEYHPDKIAARGLPKEFTELANQKFREIQQAWETLRTSRGF